MKKPPLLPSDHRLNRVATAVRDNLAILLGVTVAAWALEFVDLVLFGFLDQFGIRPRNPVGLLGIAVAPFLHLGFGHLVSNTLPFLILGGFVLIGGRRVFATASIFILGVGGGAVWMLGPAQTNHIGASLLIFGYLGFLLARGVFQRSAFWIGVSLFILLLYGGMLVGTLPGQPGVSWQGHLFGFVAGVLSARVLTTRSRPAAEAG